MNYYLDACSTTPILDSVIDEISYVHKYFWGNSSSIHKQGIEAARILERSRLFIARKFNILPEQIFFTRGATQSNHIALSLLFDHFKSGLVLTSSVEHPSIFNAINLFKTIDFKVSYLPVDKYGSLNINTLKKYIIKPTKFMSIIWAQSEIGTIQPIYEISNLCKLNSVLLHIDATQIFAQGIIDLTNLYYDFVSLSAHKFRGPKGVGLLIANEKFVSNKTSFNHINNILASMNGTIPVSLIAGMSKAIENLNTIHFMDNNKLQFCNSNVARNTNLIRDSLMNLPGLEMIGHPTNRLPNHISFVLRDSQDKPVSGRHVVRLLSTKGISVSSGTACQVGENNDSHVLKALGLKDDLLQSGIRISLGEWLTINDIKNIIPILKSTILDIISNSD